MSSMVHSKNPYFILKHVLISLISVKDDRDVLKEEFVVMMSAWSIEEEAGMIFRILDFQLYIYY